MMKNVEKYIYQNYLRTNEIVLKLGTDILQIEYLIKYSKVLN